MTPDQLTAIIDCMTPGSWTAKTEPTTGTVYRWTDGEIPEAVPRSSADYEGRVYYPMLYTDALGIVALRNHASALVECAKLLKSIPDRCDIHTQFPTVADEIDAAIKRLEEIK